MPHRIRLPLALLLCLTLGTSQATPRGVATPSSPSHKALDQKGIYAEYNEGYFDHVLTAIEGFMSRNKTYSLEDSVFIAKHLAVVYSASPDTREKCKYYMYRLLTLLPTARKEAEKPEKP